MHAFASHMWGAHMIKNLTFWNWLQCHQNRNGQYCFSIGVLLHYYKVVIRHVNTDWNSLGENVKINFDLIGLNEKSLKSIVFRSVTLATWLCLFSLLLK